MTDSRYQSLQQKPLNGEGRGDCCFVGSGGECTSRRCRLLHKIWTTKIQYLICRTEQEIRDYFSSGGSKRPPHNTTTNGCTIQEQQQQTKPRLPPPSEDDFKKWFPGLALSKTACTSPRFRVVCFANAGNAEDMYTSEGTGVRRAPSPLLVGFCSFVQTLERLFCCTGTT